MQRLSPLLTANKILLLILLISAFLRFTGVSPGYPPYHSDEGISYSSAVEMIKNNNLDPGRYDYPSIVPMSNFLFFKFFFIPVSWVGYYVSHFGELVDGFIQIPPTEEEYRRIFQLEILGSREVNALAWGRYVTALFGTGVVLLTYLVATKLFNQKAGLLSGLLVAVNYREVLNSHLGLPDIYNAFFLLLAFLSALYLWEKPTRIRYLAAAVAAGLSFSTKYQFFAFLPLLLVHLYLTFREKGWKRRARYLLQTNALIVSLVIALTFLLLNPYHLIRIEETIDWITFVSTKYRPGRMMLDFYPLSYLYHIGIGKITSVLILLGTAIAILRSFKKTGLLLSVVLPFFFVTIYYTGGGFYTRNFVTIIPFLFIFAGFFLTQLTKLKPRTLQFILLFALLFPAVWENLPKSIVVSSEYVRPWNFEVLSSWLSENIPAGSKIAAHSSVPLPIEDVERLPYDFHLAFSVEEFREAGAEFAIANLDWATNEFYWWMTANTEESLRFWNKPISILEQTYAAMALRELSQFTVYSVLNSWPAPDSNFIVAKIPNYNVREKKEITSFSFVPATDVGWQSPPIEVKGWPGFFIEYEMKSSSSIQEIKAGYISASFFASREDIGDVTKRLGIRISRRNTTPNEVVQGDLVGRVPEEANFMVIGFHSYDSSSSLSKLDEVTVYKADIEERLGNFKVKPLELDTNLLFPNSHGYL